MQCLSFPTGGFWQWVLIQVQEVACPEISRNLSLLIVSIRYVKLCTTNQQKLACSWPSHHYLCANYSPCKAAKLEAHKSCKAGPCHTYFSAWLLPQQFFCLPCPLSVFYTHKAPRFFLLFSEHNSRPDLLSCWHPQGNPMSYVDFTLHCNMGSHLGQWHSPHQCNLLLLMAPSLPVLFCLPRPLFLLKRFLLHTHKTPSSFRFLQRKT